MNERELQHMYQAWQQGNDHYKRDWSYFVEFTAKHLNKTQFEVMQALQRCQWFSYTHEDK
jgi:hypothetical protein